MLTHLILSMVLAASAMAYGGETERAVEGLRSSDPVVVQRSIGVLRTAGPEGLRAALASYDRQPDPALGRAVDEIAGQHDALWSRLYWYADLDSAKAAARAQHKPILYLRLLGKLTDEYSCANSRFFRTVLYANESVSDLLRERFVLVWSSERPVPVVTIDYGDGRVLKRTLTGNSAHYVLDSEGRVIDTLPGLLDPQTFAELLTGAADVAATGSEDARRRHFQSGGAARSGGGRSDVTSSGGPAHVAARPAPDAAEAGQRAPSKMAVERRVLRATSRELAAAIDLAGGATSGPADARAPRLDQRSIDLIRSQNPQAYSDPVALARTVAQLERSISEDTVRNQELRRQALAWLQQNPLLPVEELNSRVYTELFLMPRSDPWLGLVVPDAYSALKDDGRCVR